ncbi:NAC domain-containing protein 68-like [Papaver somniferum]|uniref:NAC domain-containing protein 68-like n=1 Tax=Papaver somniferum TaxID=3469 RepID=UPI000E702006|nr:NAC domain-containing protein 68-like [Papaver somniferum]
MSSPSAKTNTQNAVTDEMKLSSLPSGFTFMPTDAVLMVYYLAKKNLGEALPPNLMKEVPDFYSYHPKELMQKYTGYEPKKPTDWYFFTGKYHGEGDVSHCTAGTNTAGRTNRVRVRVAGQGFWQPTKHISPIYPRDSPNLIGRKHTWDYYEVRDSKEYKTDYVMQEYTTTTAEVRPGGNDSEEEKNKKDEFVLCRIYDRKTRATDDPMIY